MLAAAITRCLRTTDSGFRYGGEEFVILLPETAAEATSVLAERLRCVFADQEVISATEKSIRCTVSVGVAESLPGESESSLMRRADDACYEAKRRGKNCIFIAPLPS